jgi:hypothetical protein
MNFPLLTHCALCATLAAATLAAATGLHAPAAHAQSEQVSVAIRIIIAGQDGSGVAPDLAPLTQRLQQQFPRFSSFTQHSFTSITLTGGQEHRIGLPGDGTATLVFTGMESGQFGFDVRIPGGTTHVRMPTDSILFVGGAGVPGGTLIIMLDT